MSDMVVIYLRFGGKALPTSSAQNKPPKKDGTGKCYDKTRNGGQTGQRKTLGPNEGRQSCYKSRKKGENKIFRLEIEEALESMRIKIQLGGTCNSARAKALKVTGHSEQDDKKILSPDLNVCHTTAHHIP
jgi:hypothetical protein